MKKLSVLLILILALLSCKKDKSTSANEPDPYAKPWNTKFITFKNDRCSSHASGYTTFYKDLKLWSVCTEYNGNSILQSISLNDSILFLVAQFNGYGNTIHHTKDGGFTWQAFGSGWGEFIKLQTINTELSYTVVRRDTNIYSLSGIGKSNLSVYMDTLKKGTHTILDSGTTITHLDSTLININDSVSFVIKFK